MSPPAPPPKQGSDEFESSSSLVEPSRQRDRKPVVNALVLTAFDDVTGFPGETEPWRETFDFTDVVNIDGIPSPVRLTQDGLGIVRTGIGKPAAATTTTAVIASEQFDLSRTLFLTVGVAGGPPDLPVGSVVVPETIVDWDHKYRVDPSEDDETVAVNPHTGGAAFTLNHDLVEWALGIAREVDLSSENESDRVDAVELDVVTGTNVCGDEIWHGQELARQVARLVDQHDMGPYRAAEMEDAGTSFALDRYGYLDHYLCIRGISNHDRPAAEHTGMESLLSSDFDAGFEQGIQSAVAVGRRIVEQWMRATDSTRHKMIG